ncbi:MAG: hypothetical protein Q9210_006752 [Variospora velana]
MYFPHVLCALLVSIVPTALALPASDSDAPKAVKLSPKRATTASIVDIDYIEHAGGRWFTDVDIGGQELSMMVDTGSGDLWVYGPKVENSGNRKIYTPTTRPIRAETFEVRYGIVGEEIVSGIVVKDTVGMGSVSIRDVPVEVATDVSVELPADGFLGMGHFNSKVMMKSLESPVFTLDLSDPVDAMMTLGSVDHSRYTGELTTVPAVTEFAGWVLGNVSFAVNGVPMGFTQEEMAVDTGGGSTMRVDPGIAQTYYDAVVGAQLSKGMSWQGLQWTIPCATKLPDLTVTIAGANIVIPGGQLVLNKRDQQGSMSCQGAVQATERHGHGNLANFLFVSQFVAFNIAEKTISFAPYAPSIGN